MLKLPQPRLLLDVDGVLIPYAASHCPVDFQNYTFFGERIWLSKQHGRWLQSLLDSFQIVWATGWEHDANTLLAPLLDLPPFPVITWQRDTTGLFTKFPAITQHIGDEPLIWIDDQLGPEAWAWAAGRPYPTLLLATDPAVGLTATIIDACRAFAQALPTNVPASKH